jgi:8-oxo-dGTP diphosphatase
MASSPRVSAKAIIIQEQNLLVIVNHNENGEWFCLPGGGQEKLESLPEALQRECLEEIGVHVQVGALWFVRDYIAKNHQFAAINPDYHGLELMFECFLEDDAQPKSGSNPDDLQIGVRWISLLNLEQQPLYPQALARAILGSERGIYLGDIN